MIPVKREATLISSVSRPSTASDDGGTRSSSTPGDLSSRGHWHLPQHGGPAMWCICGGIGMQTCHSGWQVLKRLNVVAAGHRGHRSTGITPNDVSSNVASKDSNGLSSTQAEALAKVSRMRARSRQCCPKTNRLKGNASGRRRDRTSTSSLPSWAATARVDRARGARGPLTLRGADDEGRGLKGKQRKTEKLSYVLVGSN